MASSSSATACPKLYDAFISHRGSDVKETLAKQLYELLRERGCRAFLDRPELQAGESIPIALRNAICSSLVQIAIFSPGYANSSWCLDELVLMLQQTDALFIPVFYNVQPWELRYIENENSRYAEAFSYYERRGRYLDKLDEWRKALKSAADISGFVFSQDQDNLCENIVSRVLQVVQNRIPLDVAKYPVGLAELVEEFEGCLETRKHKRPRTMDKVTIAGIYGLGGSGKTTLAKELFNKKRSGYCASTFLFDVRESYTRGELHCLQSQLLKDLLGIEDLRISSVDHGIGVLKDSLERARHLQFLIVLDDIDHLDQLDALLPQGMLSSSSLIIITTRDQSMLTDADICYKMKELNRDQANDLFCSHAFRGQDPPVAYEKLVKSFVQFCGGLPLSLKVVGAHLYGRKEYYWKLELEKVQKIQPKDIMQRLKISFDGLDQEEQQIFIDIACFFNKTLCYNLKSMAISVWKASGWSGEHALQALQDKSLVEIDDHTFEMHDHLRDLGRQMADDLRPPRLWRPQILRSMEAKGFKQILAETKVRCFHRFYDSSLQTKIDYFIGTSNDSADTDLLGLRIDNETFNSEERGRLKKIPSWIPLRKLHYLFVHRVEEMWSGFHQQLQTNTQASFELRNLEISFCPHLQKLPELIGMFCHLEELRIERSLEKTDMTSLSESIKQLSNLRSLHLEGGNQDQDQDQDQNLFNLEASTRRCTASLETIYFGTLPNISKLLISREICPKLRSLTVHCVRNLKLMDLKHLERLNTLKVEYCYLETISGLSSLTGLQSLTVTYCDKMKTISGLSSLTGLQTLTVTYCDKLETISGLSSLIGLQSLTVTYCDKLKTISELSSLMTGLKSVKVKYCPNLETISGLSSLTGLQVFEVKNCKGLKSLPTLPHQRHLGRFEITGCDELQSVEGFGEWPELKSLIIEVPHNGCAWVRNFIYGLKRLPSKETILVGMPVDRASSRLDVNLFSEVTDVQALESDEVRWVLPSSSNAITIYVLLGSPREEDHSHMASKVEAKG